MSQYHNHLLQNGSTGDAVSALQNMLNAAGYSVDVDGDFGDRTHHAVVAFQKSQRLDADGVVGPKTWQTLASLVG